MDSEDETFANQLDQHVKEGGLYSIKVDSMIKSIGYSIGMRLYQMEEWEVLNSQWEQAKRLYDDSIVKDQVEDIDELCWSCVGDSSAIHRFRRFLDSIKGFHSGSLDYTGRHEYRYRRLNARWNKFLTELLKISRHATKVIVPEKGPHGTPIDSEGKSIPTTEYIMDRPELLEKFQGDWRTGALSFSLLFRCTEELLQYLSEHPTPIFQKLVLRDLPPELVDQIVQMAGLDDARRLGSTSRHFREIASPYFYSVRVLDMPFRPAENAFDTEEEKSFIEPQVQRARDTLLDELDFVISRPDILKLIVDITMFGRRYDYAKSKLEIETGSPQYMELFSPIQPRIDLILQKVENLKVLTLNHVVITQDVIQAIAALHGVTEFSAHACKLAKVPKLPLCLSVNHVTLALPPNGDVSLLALMESFPAMHFLHLIGAPRLDETRFFEMRAKLNPFSPLKRLILDEFNHTDTPFFAQWIQAAPNLQLTHVWIKSRGFNGGFDALLGIFPPIIQSTLHALSMAPLQVLIIDRLWYAKPDIFDKIAGVFPRLRALTLFYSKSQVFTRWPHASWEYAPHFSGFSRLEFFGWNFHVDAMAMGFHHTLQFFEDGFPGDQPETEDDEPIESFEDWKFNVRLLTTYCPTLKCIVYHPDTECRIIQIADGGVVVTEGGPGWVSDWKEKNEFPTFLASD